MIIFEKKNLDHKIGCCLSKRDLGLDKFLRRVQPSKSRLGMLSSSWRISSAFESFFSSEEKRGLGH